MTPTLAELANRAFDHIPGGTVVVGTRTVPTFRSTGILGFHVALTVAIAVGIVADVPMLSVLGLAATAGGSFFAWGYLRRAVTGTETLVLFEHVWVALGAVSVYLWAVAVPLRSGLDVLAIGLCVFLAFGRLGCLAVGCCHGSPCAVGPAYRPESGVTARLVGVRLFPVQLVEAGALLAIGMVGLVWVGSRPGTATVWVLAAYATVRFGLETWRGDPRPTIAGASLPRAMAAIQLGAAVVLSELWWDSVGTNGRVLAASAPVLATAVGGVLLERRRQNRLTTPPHLDETWALIRGLARSTAGEDGDLERAGTSEGLVVAASWESSGLRVSFSHLLGGVDGVIRGLGLVAADRTAAATHVVVPAERLGIVRRRGHRSEPAETTYNRPEALAATVLPPRRGANDYFGDRPSS